jgi:hypothetical protein
MIFQNGLKKRIAPHTDPFHIHLIQELEGWLIREEKIPKTKNPMPNQRPKTKPIPGVLPWYNGIYGLGREPCLKHKHGGHFFFWWQGKT